MGVTALADRPEGFAFRPAGAKRTGRINTHFARQAVGAQPPLACGALLAIHAGMGLRPRQRTDRIEVVDLLSLASLALLGKRRTQGRKRRALSALVNIG